MKKLLLAGLAGLMLSLMALTGFAQRPSRIYSNPEIPSDEALRRLNLKVQWYRYVPTEGRRDGVLTAQLLGGDLLVQTRAGLVIRMDAETGAVRWRARPGNPYEAYQALSANRRSVFVVNNNYLFSLDRNDGAMQWRSRLPAGVSAPPIVGELAIFLPTSTGKLYALTLPVTDFLASRADRSSHESISPYPVTSNGKEGAIGPQPAPFWAAETGLRLEHSPLQTAEVVFCVSPTGNASAYAKLPREGREESLELYRFTTDRPIAAAPGQFGDVAYIGSQDANLYALHIPSGKLDWRFTAGSAVTRQPVALETDVYVTTEKEGLTRLARSTGEAVWRIPSGRGVTESNVEADRFMAANTRYVYATDSSGRLLILDRRRGNRLSMLDTHHFRFTLPNRVTDRIYLAANDGLVLCLRDRDQELPIHHRKLEEEAADPIKKKLNDPAADTGGRTETLRIVIAGISKKYGLKVVVVERAFKEAGVDNILDKDIKIPKIDKITVGAMLDLLLKQVNATYEALEDSVLILPGKPRER